MSDGGPSSSGGDGGPRAPTPLTEEQLAQYTRMFAAQEAGQAQYAFNNPLIVHEGEKLEVTVARGLDYFAAYLHDARQSGLQGFVMGEQTCSQGDCGPEGAREAAWLLHGIDLSREEWRERGARMLDAHTLSAHAARGVDYVAGVGVAYTKEQLYGRWVDTGRQAHLRKDQYDAAKGGYRVEGSTSMPDCLKAESWRAARPSQRKGFINEMKRVEGEGSVSLYCSAAYLCALYEEVVVAEHGVQSRGDDRPLMGTLEVNQFLSMVRDGDMIHAPHAAYLINNGRHSW